MPRRERGGLLFSVFARGGMRATALLLSLSVLSASCNSATPPARSRSEAGPSVRYRLLLRDNAVDPGEASRCYGRCQAAATPALYLECLSSCPGFEKTDGE